MVFRNVGHRRKLVVRLGKQQLDRAPRTGPVLFNNDFDFTDVSSIIVILLTRATTLVLIIVFIVLVVVVPVEETNDIGILFDRSGFPDIGQDRPLILTLLHSPGPPGKGDHWEH